MSKVYPALLKQFTIRLKRSENFSLKRLLLTNIAHYLLFQVLHLILSARNEHRTCVFLINQNQRPILKTLTVNEFSKADIFKKYKDQISSAWARRSIITFILVLAHLSRRANKVSLYYTHDPEYFVVVVVVVVVVVTNFKHLFL